MTAPVLVRATCGACVLIGWLQVTANDARYLQLPDAGQVVYLSRAWTVEPLEQEVAA